MEVSQQIKKTDWPGGQLKFLVKAVISAGMLAWMLSRIPLGSLEATLITCQWTCLMAALGVVNACMLVSALKWQPLLYFHRIKIPFFRLLSYYYAGLFANNFLPSGIGGDALRIYDTARESGKTGEAAASVIMERLLASLALGLTAAVALLFAAKPGGGGYIPWVVGGITSVCLILTAVLLICPFRRNSKAAQWFKSLGKYRQSPGILGRVLVLSFLFQALLVLANILVFQSLNTDIPVISHFLYIPVIMAVSMLPLSVNGIGIREGMYVLLYGYSGIDPATAMLGALLFFTLVTVTSLAGGMILLLRR